jgi:hypothetical protein
MDVPCADALNALAFASNRVVPDNSPEKNVALETAGTWLWGSSTLTVVHVPIHCKTQESERLQSSPCQCFARRSS